MNPKVDQYISKAQKWQEELKQLRKLLLDCALTEELKWGVPCYTFQNKNLILIGGFKAYCALSFFKGVLLKDTNKILKKPGDNSQSVRLIRFTNVQEILNMATKLKAYIQEAIEIENAGLKVNFKEKTPLVFPEELLQLFKENPALKVAFEALTPGRQRGYNLYFSAPKQSKTRISRIEKYTSKILSGKGFHDCTCGLSKKMPSCDGSHKFLV